MTTNRTAEDAYAEAHAKAMAMIDEIRERIESLPAPGAATQWGHVADMTSILDWLENDPTREWFA